MNKWLTKNGIYFEENKSQDNEPVFFLKYENKVQVNKHLKRCKINYKATYACNYEWLVITLKRNEER